VGRARSKNPKQHQHCLRLTDHQEELLQRYTSFRGYATDMDAIRGLIDGLDDWFRRQQAKLVLRQAELNEELSALRPHRTAADGAQAKPVASRGAMRPEVTDVAGSPALTDVEPSDVEDGPPVGDFAGRPSVRLPESYHDGND
jgi:hypothetical protein